MWSTALNPCIVYQPFKSRQGLETDQIIRPHHESRYRTDVGLPGSHPVIIHCSKKGSLC